MSTVTLRDVLDELEHRLAGAGASVTDPARSGGWVAVDDDEEDDLFGEDDLGFDDIDETDEDDLDDDLDEEDLDEDVKDDPDEERVDGRGGPLLEAGPRLAHERDGLGEDDRHHGADLLSLLLGVALEVDAVDRGDRHVDRELDGVVGPGQPLLALHLVGELGHAPLKLLRIAEQSAESFHAQSLPARAPIHSRHERMTPSASWHSRALERTRVAVASPSSPGSPTSGGPVGGGRRGQGSRRSACCRASRRR